MALNLRIPADLDQSLTELAEAENSSKHALVLEGIRRIVEERRHMDAVDEGVDYALDHDAQALAWLADS